MSDPLTTEERKNGWDEASLEEYLAEREAMSGFTDVHKGQLRVQSFIGGNVVTEFERPRRLPAIENTIQHNPHNYWR